MSFFGGSTNATQNQRLLGYRVSTSISGSAIKVVFGTNRVSGNVIWSGDWVATPVKQGGKGGKASAKGGGAQYTYKTAAMISLVQGPIAGLGRVWQDRTLLGTGGAGTLGLSLVTGVQGQAPWGYLSTKHPDQALGYTQLAYVCNSSFDLGTAGTMPNLSYEIEGFSIFGSGIVDALCSDVISTLLTDTFLGAGLDISEVDTTEIDTYCRANSLFVSPVLDSQKPAAEWLNELLLISNAEAVWSGGVLKLRARDDVAASGNGATYVPNVTPVYDLDDDDFKDREEPVRITRSDVRDAYNQVRINWTNRDNEYNTEPCEEKDRLMIETWGLRPASPVDALGICRSDVAAKVAHIQLKRNIYFRTRYKFKLGFEHILLEPMDVVTLTSSYQGLDRQPVRILSIEEDDDGYLTCEAEEFTANAAAPALHPKQTTGAFTPPFYADPGDVNAPIFFDAPPELLAGRNPLTLISLSGGQQWGGCGIHISHDGSTYEYLGRWSTKAVMGYTSADLAYSSDPDTTGTLSLDLITSQGAIDSVSQSAVDALKSLMLVDTELMAYRDATLTGANQYDLSYLHRGVYGTWPVPHGTGEAFTLLDGSQFEYDYPFEDVGKTVWFKFTSFNLAGQHEQDIADVVAYPHTLTGGLSRSALAWHPPATTNLPSTLPSSFAIRQITDVLTNGDSQLSLAISGPLPANAFSSAIAPPSIPPVATVVNSGGTIPIGDYVIAVWGIDADGMETTPVFATAKVTVNNSKIEVPVTWDSSTANYGYSIGTEIDELRPASGSGTPGTITITAIPGQLGLTPDPLFSRLRVYGQTIFHGGVWGATCTAIGSYTLQFAGATWTTNQWAGRTVALYGRLSAFHQRVGDIIHQIEPTVVSNTADTLTIDIDLSAYPDIVSVGDVWVMRMKPVVSGTTVTDTNFIHDWAPSGLNPDQEIGKAVRIIRGKGARQTPRPIISATSTSFTVDRWDEQPDSTSVFVVVERTWSYQFDTAPLSSTGLGQLLDAGPPELWKQVAVPDISNYGNSSVYFECVALDANGDPSSEPDAPYREVWIWGAQGTRVIGSNTNVLPGDGTIEVDTSAGPVTVTFPDALTMLNQKVIVQKISTDSNLVTVIGADRDYTLVNQWDWVIVRSSY